MRAALAVRDLPALLSSGSYQLAKSNLSLGIVTEQVLPSMRTFQKLSSPSPVWKHTYTYVICIYICLKCCIFDMITAHWADL